MIGRRWRFYIFLAVMPGILAGIAGCAGDPIPPVDHFMATPVGTLLPGGEEMKPLQVPPESSGVVFLNQSGSPIRVAVNNTITEVPVKQGFVFLLPPGAHKFYIYDMKGGARIYNEKVDQGKFRYVYYVFGGPPG
jgi:hypothetical protein